MNKKNKNKNRNKIPNPLPPKSETENVVPESETKMPENKNIVPQQEVLPKEDREVTVVTHQEVIEKISEKQEQEKTNLDTPKKPKRNRNKKKKGESELVETLTDKSLSQDDSNLKILQDSDITAPIKNDEKSKESERPITPAGDKKNKKNEKQNVQPSNKTVPDTPKPTEDRCLTPSEKEPSKENITQTENKDKKKHKKGKKRNDSEKSEEILACTAAFQKLIVKEEIPTETKSAETEIMEPVSESSVSEATVTEALPKKLDTEIPTSPYTPKTTECETKDCAQVNTDLPPEIHKKGKHKKHTKEPPVTKEMESSTVIVTHAIEKENTKNLDIQITEIESLKTQKAADEPSPVTEVSQKVSTEQETLDKNTEVETSKKSNKKKKHKPIPPVIEAEISHSKEEIKIDILELATESNNDNLKTVSLKNIGIKSKPSSEEIFKLTSQITETKDPAATQDISEDTPFNVTPSLEMVKKEEFLDVNIHQKTKSKIVKQVKKDAKCSTDTTEIAQHSKSPQEELLSSLEIKKDSEEPIISPTCTLIKKPSEKNIETLITEPDKSKPQQIQYLDRDDKMKSDDNAKFNIIEATNIPTESKKEEMATKLTEEIKFTLASPEIGTEIKDKAMEVGEIKIQAEEQVETPNQSKTDSLKRQKKRNKHQTASELPKQEIKEAADLPKPEIKEAAHLPKKEIKEADVSKDSDPKLKTEQIQEILTQKINVPDLPLTTPDQIEYPRPASADEGDMKRIIKDVFVTEITHTSDKDIIKQQDYKVEVPKTPAPKEVGPKKQKTDLKSKVIEVNKDMEDLKISIEKSLAELTALEDKEKEMEHNFETKLQESLKDTSKPDETPDAKSKKELLKEPELKTESIIQSLPVTTELIDIKQTKEQEQKPEIVKPETKPSIDTQHPTAPSRKDNKGKNKKRKGQQDIPTQSSVSPAASTTVTMTEQTTTASEKQKTEDNKETKEKTKDDHGKGKQQSDMPENESPCEGPIDKFEDALTSSADDVNQTFDIIVKESSCDELENEDDKITDEKQKNENIPQPKNLLGHPDIPVQSNKIDYKKEKNKTPNARQATVKIKDGTELSKETSKPNKDSKTVNKPKLIKPKNESSTYSTYDNEEFIYKYSFRNVFLSSACHVCKKLLTNSRVECSFCHLFFYCSQKHKDKDWSQHQALCFSVSTITHLKGQKHIYAGAQNITGQNYRLLRMQMIISCEKILKRKLDAWEQEAVLYPRMCADPACREWRSGELEDCGGCLQISYCSKSPSHLPPSHTRWCKSYSLYARLVIHQLLYGRIEPTLPKKCITEPRICDNLNRVLADMYDEKIDMDDLQYASLTQIATAPLTAVYCYQIYHNHMERTRGDHSLKNNLFTIHVVEAELQFEADSLTKWETFFLHLRPDVQELRVTLVGTDLNPSSLPLDLLGKVRMCDTCRSKNRRVVFKFQDKMHYHDYFDSIDFVKPDIVCSFNTAIYRSSTYNTSDIWSPTLKCIFKQHVPFVITSYSMTDLQKDMKFIEKRFHNEFNVISEGKFNPFASVRPDRNFISDDDMPLLFKNYCFCVVIGAF